MKQQSGSQLETPAQTTPGGWGGSCMGTESVGRGITTVFFKHVSHQSCQRASGADDGFMLHLRGVSRAAHVE